MTRRDEILKLIVEEFIKTHQPVASKTLLQTYDLEVCSATIRSEMSVWAVSAESSCCWPPGKRK